MRKNHNHHVYSYSKREDEVNVAKCRSLLIHVKVCGDRDRTKFRRSLRSEHVLMMTRSVWRCKEAPNVSDASAKITLM